MKPIRLLILGVLLSAAASVQAQKLTPAPYLCDSMVLQRDMPLPLEGTASPRSSVEISFADHTVTAETDAQGVCRPRFRLWKPATETARWRSAAAAIP